MHPGPPPPTRPAPGGLRACPVGLVPLGWPEAAQLSDGFLGTVTGLGYAGLQVGDPGADSAPVRARLQAHGVHAAERYLAIRCDDDGPVAGAAAEGAEHVRQLAALGGTMLVAAVDGSPERDRHAGRAESAPALTADGWRRLVALLAGVVARAEDAGVAVSFHPHAGTYVETPAEARRLLEAADDRLGLCLDTGHWLVGGGDPRAAIAAYGGRITHVHLKDVDAAVLRRLRSGSIATLSEAVDAIVFGALGSGLLDLDGVLTDLDELGYGGWLMVEQDSFAGTPAEAAAISRRALDRALTRLA